MNEIEWAIRDAGFENPGIIKEAFQKCVDEKGERACKAELLDALIEAERQAAVTYTVSKDLIPEAVKLIEEIKNEEIIHQTELINVRMKNFSGTCSHGLYSHYNCNDQRLNTPRKKGT